MDAKSDNLEKDACILDMLERLRASLGSDAFDIADHWPSNRLAIGVASPKDHHVLVYIGAFDDGYFVELESPPNSTDDSPYKVAGRQAALSFGQLVEVVAKHLKLAPITRDEAQI